MLDLTDLLHRLSARHGIVTLDDLIHAGVGERRANRWVQEGRLVAVERGVYRIGGSPPSFEADVLAAVSVHGERTWASGRTAAALWGLPGFAGERRIELIRDAGLSNQRAGARVRRSTRVLDHHVTLRAGIPITTMSRTIFDLARSTGPELLDRIVEAALRTPHSSITSLYGVLYDLGGRGRPGTRRLREVLEPRGMTYVPTESELDRLGRALVSGLSGIEWQVPFSDEKGYIRRVDGFHRASGRVIEWDGAEHHSSRWDVESDRAGDERLEALGLRVKRLTWPDVTVHGPRVLAELERLVRAAPLDR